MPSVCDKQICVVFDLPDGRGMDSMTRPAKVTVNLISDSIAGMFLG